MTEHIAVFVVCLTILASACAAPQGQAQRSSSDTPGATGPTRVTAAITGDPPFFSNKLNTGNDVPGVDVVEDMLHAGLARLDSQQQLVPRLAETVPSLENGLWKLFPDGRMETSWRLRAGIQWHDGAPLTVEDVKFTITVHRDSDLPVLRGATYDLIQAIETPDPNTLTLQWREPFISADSVFGESRALPLPRHLLELTYFTDKGMFLEHPYWSTDYVGAGAYRIHEWVRSSHVVLQANDGYVLGRPRIDEIEIKFIQDQNTLLANVLAGAVEVVLSRGLSLDLGFEARHQWRQGKMEATPKNWVVLYPQFNDPDPPAVAQLAFRRALLHAIDRQQLADAVYAGLVPVAHAMLSPSDPFYKEIEREIVKYEYEPRRAGQLIETLGYSRGSDGLFRDASGQALSVQIRSTATRAERTQMLFVILDQWKAVGLNAEADVLPAQAVRDRSLVPFRAFNFTQQPNEMPAIKGYRTPPPGVPPSSTRTYRNPELDGLIDRLFSAVPIPERTRALGQVIHHMTDQLVALGVVYGMDTFLISNRLRNVGPAEMTWNVHQWEVQ